MDVVYIAQINPKTKRCSIVHYFLGDHVPSNVLNAANRNPPNWAAPDAKLLADHFGKSWRDKLTPRDVKPAQTQGGAAADAADDADAATFDIFNNDDIPTEVIKARAPAAKDAAIIFNKHSEHVVIEYHGLSIYPYDTVFDVRQKLHMVFGIALYRQHFFYVNDQGDVQLPYKINLDGIPVNIMWEHMCERTTKNSIAGIFINNFMETQRDSIVIESYDMFTSCASVFSQKRNGCYFVDLYDIVAPLGTPTAISAAILNDKYQFDLLYYGALLQFWPHLSKEAAFTALSAPANMYTLFPQMCPHRDELSVRFLEEQKIAKSVEDWTAENSKTKIDIAITSATIFVYPRSIKLKLAIRNIFDWIPTSNEVAAMRFNMDIDVSMLPEFHQSGLLHTVATKRFITSHHPKKAVHINSFLAKPGIKNTITFALARRQNVEHLISQYVYVTLNTDGKLEASTDWREDDHATFTEVISEVTTNITQLLSEINEMGAIAFPIGGKLELKSQKAKESTSVGNITISTFWYENITSAAFKELKNRFKILEAAGLITIKGLQQSNAYTIYFRKGIVSYNRQQILQCPNQYAFLFDPQMQQRWDGAFIGRAVHIFHRVTDLKIEVLNTYSEEEYYMIRRFIFGFIDDAFNGRDKIVNKIKNQTDIQILRRLQERDPVLYDLKKYGKDATVYSVLCQAGRQPNIYNSAEIKHLPDKTQKELVKYWNFTNDEPAFYKCPNRRYPYINFKVGHHPLGYCLPCCKKSPAISGSKSAQVNSKCLERKGPGDNSGDELSKHILSYGKYIPPNRLSDLPKILTNGLMLGVVKPPYQLCLLGVPQNNSVIANTGFTYSVLYAMETAPNETGVSVFHEILEDLSAIVEEMTDTYHSLGDGIGSEFESAAAIADAIRDAFIRESDSMSPFGPGGFAEHAWESLFTELVRLAYNIEIIVFDDEELNDNIELNISQSTAISAIKPNTQLILLIRNFTGVYPIVMLEPKIYLRLEPSEYWEHSRRIFGGNYGENVVADSAVVCIRAMITSQIKFKKESVDLALVLRYCDQRGAKFKLKLRLINLHNLCYGVILSSVQQPSDEIFFSVEYSAYSADNEETLLFDMRPRISINRRTLMAAIQEINDFIKTMKEHYMYIEHHKNIIAGDKVVGFLTKSGQYFYHDPEPIDRENLAGLLEDVKFPYDPLDIDEAVIDAMRNNEQHTPPADIQSAAFKANYKNKLYQLFLAEFSNILRKDKNTKMRNSIINMFESTRNLTTDAMSEICAELKTLLTEFPEDFAAIQRALTKTSISPNWFDLMSEQLEKTNFLFDQTILRGLQKMTHRETVEALKKIIHIHIVDSPVFNLSNMYISCSEKTAIDQPYCKNSKLVVAADRVDELFDILAFDIHNDGKARLLASLSAGVFNPFNFIRRKYEHLTINTA